MVSAAKLSVKHRRATALSAWSRHLCDAFFYLRSHDSPPTTPLLRVFNTPARVTPSVLTATLRDCVQYLGPDLGFLPSEVSARSLRAARATALLLARVDTDVIRLIGRWRSDKMLRYLHVQAYHLCVTTHALCWMLVTTLLSQTSLSHSASLHIAHLNSCSHPQPPFFHGLWRRMAHRP